MRRNIEKKLKLTFSKVMKLEQGNIKREELKYQWENSESMEHIYA